MSETNRKVFTGNQKAKVALEAVKNQKAMNEIAQEFGVHPTQIGVWKKILVENSWQSKTSSIAGGLKNMNRSKRVKNVSHQKGGN